MLDKSPRNEAAERDIKTKEINPQKHPECPYSDQGNHQLQNNTLHNMHIKPKQYTKQSIALILKSYPYRTRYISTSLVRCIPPSPGSFGVQFPPGNGALRSWWPNSISKLALTWLANCLTSIWRIRHTAVDEPDLPRIHLLRPTRKRGLSVSNSRLSAGIRLIPWICSW